MLTLTNLINKNYRAAEKFIKTLKKSMIYNKWAISYEKYLYDHELCENDLLFIDKRNVLPEEHFFIRGESPNVDLYYLLRANGNNKMAFEYLIAYYLLTKKVANIVAKLRKFEELIIQNYPGW